MLGEVDTFMAPFQVHSFIFIFLLTAFYSLDSNTGDTQGPVCPTCHTTSWDWAHSQMGFSNSFPDDIFLSSPEPDLYIHYVSPTGCHPNHIHPRLLKPHFEWQHQPTSHRTQRPGNYPSLRHFLICSLFLHSPCFSCPANPPGCC